MTLYSIKSHQTLLDMVKSRMPIMKQSGSFQYIYQQQNQEMIDMFILIIYLLFIWHKFMKSIPPVFYGTAWKKEKTAILVETALKQGFRAIDTACQPKHYNQAGVGDGIANSGIPRDDIFIQTKYTPFSGQDPNNVPYNPKNDLASQVRTSLEVSLKNLRTNYIDSLVLHSPMNSLAKTIEVWKVFQQFIDQGKVHCLGISNCYDPQFFQGLYNQVKVKPIFIQNRFYSQSGYDVKIRAFCDKNKIRYQSFWTLTANPHILGSKQMKQLSKKYQKTSEQILYKILVELGIIPLIGTTSIDHMKQDLGIFSFNIAAEDIKTVQNMFK